MDKEKTEAFSFQEKELIYMREGLFGFEEQHKFLPLPVEEDSDRILCLQSVEDEALSFIIMNPFYLSEEYAPVLSSADFDKLGTQNEAELSFYVICVLDAIPEKSTVNLKCPIVVNTVTRQAVQVILESKEYQFRHALKQFIKEGA